MMDNSNTDFAGEAIRRAYLKAREAESIMRTMKGPELIQYALASIADTQAELARLSGLTPNTVRAIKQGKKASAAQRAAICWAIVVRWTGRHE